MKKTNVTVAATPVIPAIANANPTAGATRLVNAAVAAVKKWVPAYGCVRALHDGWIKAHCESWCLT